MIEISQISINHMTTPLGFDLDNHLHIEFSVNSSKPMTETKKESL